MDAVMRHHTSLIRKWGWSIALAAALAWTLPVLAQYRITTDGHNLDASNRIGSNGYNAAVQTNPNPNSNEVTQEDIFLGNVSGLGGFHGGFDRGPGAFTGNLPPEPSLQLQRVSGTSSPTAAPTYNRPQPYFNEQTSSGPPPGFEQIPGTGSYMQSPTPTLQPGDYRLGATLDVPVPTLPGRGEIMGPGQVDPTATLTPTFLSGAPLPALRAYSTTQPVSYAPGQSVITNTLAMQLSEGDINRLRAEVNQNATQWQPSNPPPAVPSPGAVPVMPLAGAQAITSPNISESAAVVSGASNSSPGDVSTGESQRQYIAALPPPAEQSPQYAKLQELLSQYQSAHPQSDQEANRLFQAALRARREYIESLSNPTMETPVLPLPGATNPPGVVMPVSPANLAPPAPLAIGSIGQSIVAPGLSQLVRQGEDLAHHQKFKDAIAKFMDARQVAPNNMLITVDLANAELGAGFYEEAEQYLREAFTADPALLMGRYDLKSLIGDGPLQILIAELKRVASNSDSATPVFLLAYLSYNTGDTDKAVEYLKLAQRRAGGQDDVIRSLGEHWSLPATQPSK
jgi:tetratricopeptide (TPR) repeat protein